MPPDILSLPISQQHYGIHDSHTSLVLEDEPQSVFFLHDNMARRTTYLIRTGPLFIDAKYSYLRTEMFGR